MIEPMITLAKVDTVANRRLAFDRLRDRDSVTKLFNVLGPRNAQRPGGYTYPEDGLPRGRQRSHGLCGTG